MHRSEKGRHGHWAHTIVPVEPRLSETCNVIENEYHLLMECSLYTDIRNGFIRDICAITINFVEASMEEKFLHIISNPLYYRIVGHALHSI